MRKLWRRPPTTVFTIFTWVTGHLPVGECQVMINYQVIFPPERGAETAVADNARPAYPELNYCPQRYVLKRPIVL